MNRTCVFCASSDLGEELAGIARALGEAVARAGDELVYGGTTNGLMGEVAAGARAAGGRVVGIVPSSMADHPALDVEADERLVTTTLGARKLAMVDGTHRFVVLAGGLGTLDELLEVLTMRQLGLLDTDIDVVVLDPTGHWSSLRRLLADLVDAGAASAAAADVRWVTDAAAAVGGGGATHDAVAGRDGR